jgi:type IV pilus assembly protein PilW
MRTRQIGMSLVEIMVAVAIGMIGILIITQAYLTGESFNRSTLGEGGAQTNGLIALYTIERDVRNGGYGIADSTALGCGEMAWFYNGNYSPNAGGTLPRVRVAPVYITVDATAPFTDPDQISIMAGGGSERMVPGSIKTFTGASNLIDLETSAGFATGDLVMLANASGCTMVQVTYPEPAPSQKIQVNANAFNPAGWGSFPVSNYAIGEPIFNLGNLDPALHPGSMPIFRTYTVANGKLRVSDAIAIAQGGSAADLIDGIVDLRAQYGKDNGVDNGTVSSATFVSNDGQVDQFSNAAPANAAEWQQVLLVRVGVLARVGTYEKPPASGVCDATTIAPTWAGGTFTAVDIATTTSEDRCYRYRVFETTIPLRNMIWRAT